MAEIIQRSIIPTSVCMWYLYQRLRHPGIYDKYDFCMLSGCCIALIHAKGRTDHDPYGLCLATWFFVISMMQKRGNQGKVKEPVAEIYDPNKTEISIQVTKMFKRKLLRQGKPTTEISNIKAKEQWNLPIIVLVVNDSRRDVNVTGALEKINENHYPKVAVVVIRVKLNDTLEKVSTERNLKTIATTGLEVEWFDDMNHDNFFFKSIKALRTILNLNKKASYNERSYQEIFKFISSFKSE